MMAVRLGLLIGGLLLAPSPATYGASGYQPSATGRVTAKITPRLTIAMTSASEHTLYDMPVSNNGARCRVILYKKGVSGRQVEIASPAALGGLRSPEYRELSPEGLMPCLRIRKSGGVHGVRALAESDTIARYLLAEYAGLGPSFLPDHPLSNQIARWHDAYLATTQGCLYKPDSRLPFGNHADRKSALAAYRRHWGVIDGFLGGDSA